MDEDKDAKIAALEALVASLRKQLAEARDTIAHYNRRSRDDYDYLPYEEDRDR